MKLSLIFHYFFLKFKQGLTRTINLALNRFTTTNLREQTLICYTNSEIDHDERICLETAINRTSLLTKAILLFHCLIFNIGILILIVFCLTGAHLLLVPVYLPYFDHTTLFGYLPNILVQAALGFNGFLTFASYDAAIMIYGHQSLTLVELFRLKIRQFQKELVADRNIKDILLIDLKIKMKLIDIIKLHDVYKNYMDEYSNLVRLPFATAVFVNIFGIFLCLNFGLTDSMVLGVGASLGLFIQLLMPLIIAILQSIQVRFELFCMKIKLNFFYRAFLARSVAFRN